jgi:hypothetical protein
MNISASGQNYERKNELPPMGYGFAREGPDKAECTQEDKKRHEDIKRKEKK